MFVPHNDFHSVPTFNRCWSNVFFHLMYHLTLTSRLELPDGTGRYFYVHNKFLQINQFCNVLRIQYNSVIIIVFLSECLMSFTVSTMNTYMSRLLRKLQNSITPPHSSALVPRLTPGVILPGGMACQVCQKADGPCDILFSLKFRNNLKISLAKFKSVYIIIYKVVIFSHPRKALIRQLARH